MFKSLIGKGHAEFATKRQQDAQEYLLHVLNMVEVSLHSLVPGTSEISCFEAWTKWLPFYRHFKMHFLWRQSLNLVHKSTAIVLEGPIDKNSVLVEVLAWHWTSDKPCPEPVLPKICDTIWVVTSCNVTLYGLRYVFQDIFMIVVKSISQYTL